MLTYYTKNKCELVGLFMLITIFFEMEINSENILCITEHIKNSPTLKTCSLEYHKFDEAEIHDSDETCLICYKIPVYPVILPCSHLFCSSCYLNKFSMTYQLEKYLLFWRCPYCRKSFKSFEAVTLQQYIEKNPNSNHAKFYNTTKRLCYNKGCTEIIELSKFVEHANTKCSQRVIQCPAPNCPFTAQLPSLVVHSNNCPFHYIWCDKCKTNWTICVKEHDCDRVIARNLIRGLQTFLVTNNNKGHLKIQLPALIKKPQPTNLHVIAKVHQLDMKKSILFNTENNASLFLIYKDTQLV